MNGIASSSRRTGQGGRWPTIAAEIGLSAERVRQVVRRADGGARPARRPGGAGGGERVRLRIGNLAKAVLVTGQAYQDPKDALNEFVSNAADDYAEAGLAGAPHPDPAAAQGRARRDRRRRRRSRDGPGPAARRWPATCSSRRRPATTARSARRRSVCSPSSSSAAAATIVSRADGSDETWTLRLRRGDASADLVRERRRRARDEPGTTVFISDLDPEAARVLTQRKVVEYLRRRRGRGDRRPAPTRSRSSRVAPASSSRPTSRPGCRSRSPRTTRCGASSSSPCTSPPTPTPPRRVAVVGRAGTTIIDDLAELEEFDREPWTSGQVSGRVVVRAAAPVGRASGDPARRRRLPGVPRRRAAPSSRRSRGPSSGSASEVDVADRRAARPTPSAQVFGRVLQGARRPREPDAHARRRRRRATATASRRRRPPPPSGDAPGGRRPAVDRRPRPRDPVRLAPTGTGGPPGRWPAIVSGTCRRSRPTPSPVIAAAGSTPTPGTVLYNDQHADFLLVKDDEAALLDYLATLVAKEYVVYNNPRADADELAEELVRMLIRVRRHLPRRSRRRVSRKRTSPRGVGLSATPRGRAPGVRTSAWRRRHPAEPARRRSRGSRRCSPSRPWR